jgi:hypothetical protein
MDDFELQLKREVNGESDGTDWKTYDPPLFADVRKMFDHPLLEEIKLSYSGRADMRFRKKPDKSSMSHWCGDGNHEECAGYYYTEIGGYKHPCECSHHKETDGET